MKDNIKKKIETLLEHVRQGSFKSLDYDEKYELVEALLDSSLDQDGSSKDEVTMKFVASDDKGNIDIPDMNDMISKIGKEPVIDMIIKSFDNDSTAPEMLFDKEALQEKVESIINKDDDEITKEDRIFINMMDKILENSPIDMSTLRKINLRKIKMKKKRLDALKDNIVDSDEEDDEDDEDSKGAKHIALNLAMLVNMLNMEKDISFRDVLTALVLVATGKSIFDDDEKSLSIFGSNNGPKAISEGYNYLADLVLNNVKDIEKLFPNQSDFVKGILYMIISIHYFEESGMDKVLDMEKIADALQINHIIDDFNEFKSRFTVKDDGNTGDTTVKPPKFDKSMFDDINKDEEKKIDDLINKTMKVRNRNDLRD